MRKPEVISLLGAYMLIAISAAAGIFRFDDQSPKGSDWMDGQNWRDQSEGDMKGHLPGARDTVRFNYGGKAGVLATDAGTIQQLQIGIDDRGGILTLNAGARLVVSGPRNYIGWNAAGSGGTLIVNGGSLTYKGWVSVANETKGSFVLNGGAVRVENVFHHNLRKAGGAAVTRVRGGVLDVNKMALNSGVLDISGGVIRIRSEISEEQTRRWIDEGLLTIKGRPGAVRDIDYQLRPWGTTGLEITVLEVPRTLGLLTS